MKYRALVALLTFCLTAVAQTERWTEWVYVEIAGEAPATLAAALRDDESAVLAAHVALPARGEFLLRTRRGTTASGLNDLVERLRERGGVHYVATCSPARPRSFARPALHVEFLPDVTPSQRAELLGSEGLSVSHEVGELPGWFRLEVDDRSRDPEQVAELVRASSLVRHSDVDWAHFVRPLSGGTMEPLFPSQWHLANDGMNGGGGVAGADIDAPDAWLVEEGDASIRIAIVDSGVETLHEDLVTKIDSPFDATDGDTDQEPNAWDPHGTACAGIAAAISDNGIGIAGVCPKASIMPVRAYLTPMSGGPAMTSDWWFASSVLYAVSHGADVINMSWSTVPSTLLTMSIQHAKSTGRGGFGCILVAAAGNDGTAGVDYPASLPEVIAVGATNQWDERKSFVSQDGDTTWASNYGPEIDLVAPGILMNTTDISGPDGFDGGNYFAFFSGTSAAAVQVSAVAALLLSQNSSQTADAVQVAMEQTAEDMVGLPSEDVMGVDPHMGHGRLNAARAVKPFIEVGGALTGNTTWQSGNVYRFVSSVTVPFGMTLTIEGGAIIKSRGDGLIVDGSLNLQSSRGDEIIFTSESDDTAGGDTNRDASATVPAPGDWSGITLNGGGNIISTVFHHVIVRYAGSLAMGCTTPALTVSGGLDLDECVFENCGLPAGMACPEDESVVFYDVAAGDAPKISLLEIRDCVGGLRLDVATFASAEVCNLLVAGGAGIGLRLDGPCTVENATVVGKDTGCAVYAPTTLQNCIFADNNGFGIEEMTIPGDPTLFHNCFWNNLAGQYLDEDFGLIMNAPLQIDTLVPPGNNAGTIIVDPLFVDAVGGDYRLAMGSPCIDAGDPASTPFAIDLDFNVRVANGTVDMGGYEFGSVSPTPALYPGTGEDLRLLGWVNLVGDGTADIVYVLPGDSLRVAFSSPFGTFNGTVPLLLGQFFNTGSPPNSPFPGIQVDPFASPGVIELLEANDGPFGAFTLPPGGFVIDYTVALSAPNLSIMLQLVSVAAFADNSIFASTRAVEVRFN